MERPIFLVQLSDQDFESAVNSRYGLVGKARIDLVVVIVMPFSGHESWKIRREIDNQ
jgi:hypothetical protein